MTSHTTIIRSIAVAALVLGAAALMASSRAAAAEPTGGQRPYSGWGSGLIEVTLVQPVGPLPGVEGKDSRLNQAAPVGFSPAKAKTPAALPFPLEHIVPLG